jgi:hypothetical protein
VITRVALFGLIVAAGLVVMFGPALTVPGRLDDALLILLAFAAYAATGGLIIFRRDGHLTGWLLTLTGLAVVTASELPYWGGMSEFVAAWISSGGWGVVFAFFAALTLTFPSGRSPQGKGIFPRLGRIALWSLPFLVVATFLTENLGGPEGGKEIPNPYGFIADSLGYVALITLVLIILAGAISLVLRRRRATGMERAQYTWVVFGLAAFVIAVLATFGYIVISELRGAGDPGDAVWGVVFAMMLIFPLTFGVAILRYRLYDIDRIVSRTVTYALVAGVLALTYFGVIALLTSLLPPSSPLAVAGSTLVVAALFNPLRRRMHRLVDRRFNRSRYDAQQVADRFARGLQDDPSQGGLTTGLLGVVSETMQPTVVSLWVRAEEPTS